MKKLLFYIGLTVLALGISIGYWHLTREFHYKVAYKEMVKKTVKEQIINLSLDIAESRRREDLMAQYIKTLDYQIDVISKSLQP